MFIRRCIMLLCMLIFCLNFVCSPLNLSYQSVTAHINVYKHYYIRIFDENTHHYRILI